VQQLLHNWNNRRTSNCPTAVGQLELLAQVHAPLPIHLPEEPRINLWDRLLLQVLDEVDRIATVRTAAVRTIAVKPKDFTDEPRTDLLDMLPRVTQPGSMQSFGRQEHLRGE
jgi:hypothetical protein